MVKARAHRFVNDAYLSGWKKLEVEANTQEEVRRGVVECKVEEQSARLDARPLFLPQVLPKINRCSEPVFVFYRAAIN